MSASPEVTQARSSLHSGTTTEDSPEPPIKGAAPTRREGKGTLDVPNIVHAVNDPNKKDTKTTRNTMNTGDGSDNMARIG